MDNSIIQNTIVSIITGVITGVLVSKHYRKKDETREKIRYLLDLSKCIINLDKECNLLLNYETTYENYRETLGVLLRICDVEVPVNFKWFRLTKEEEKSIEEFEKIYSNIRDSIGIIWFNNEEVNGLVNNFEHGRDESLTNEIYNEQLDKLINEMQSEKEKLDNECKKFRIVWPILDDIIKKYDEIN